MLLPLLQHLCSWVMLLVRSTMGIHSETLPVLIVMLRGRMCGTMLCWCSGTMACMLLLIVRLWHLPVGSMVLWVCLLHEHRAHSDLLLRQRLVVSMEL